MGALKALSGAARSAMIAAVSLAALTAGCTDRAPRAAAIGDVQHGSRLFDSQACGSCHLAPGRELARGLVGPPLSGFATRTMIAGMLPNTPGNLELWLQRPQSIVPGNAMPNLQLSPQDARDIAAYLYTLD